MSNYITFLKKELLEYKRTYKLLIMLLVFAVFGITNPLMAKLLPEIVGVLVTDGITLTLPEPSAYDAWEQFFKNATQMGLIVMVIVFSGVLASELTKGTLINILTKGLSRSSVILSKFTCMALIWTVSLALCFGLTLGYTVYLFPDGQTANLLYAVFCLWLFGLSLLAVLLFAATITSSHYGCLLLTGAAAVICMVLNIIPAVHPYNPLSLASDTMSLLTEATEASSLYGAVLTASLLSVLFIGLSVLVFKKKQI